MNYFTLYDGTDAASANKTSLSFGVGLSGSGVWNAPARKGESISIPGRNGNIWVDDGSWENIFVTYPCWIADGFDQRVDEFRGWLAQHSDQYYRITDTYHPDEYRLGRFAGEFLATPGTRNLTGRFDVVFECDPRRFYSNQELARIEFYSDETVERRDTVVNDTMFPLKPRALINFMMSDQINHDMFVRSYFGNTEDPSKMWLQINTPDVKSVNIFWCDIESGGIFLDEAMKEPYYLRSYYNGPGLNVFNREIAVGNNTIYTRAWSQTGEAVYLGIRLYGDLYKL